MSWQDRNKPKAPETVPNAQLREIAGRIMKLSYMDMLLLATTVQREWPKDNTSDASVALALVRVAESLGEAVRPAKGLVDLGEED